MQLPAAVEIVARACRAAGGRAWLVGGCVRDGLLGLPVKDHDIEVHGIGADALEALLGRLGRVDAVGRSFGVFKLKLSGSVLDVSLPRRDSNAGPGHRGIEVQGDPHMGLVEAARRRDLTINAIMLDPLTGELEDPFGGRADLDRRLLRAVDRHTFLDDPLRAVRVVQFAGRFALSLDPELVGLCRAAPLAELPAERIQAELDKLLLRAERPSLGLQAGRETRVLDRILPEVAGVDPAALDACVDRAASGRQEAGRRPRPLALMYAALLAFLSPDAATLCLDRLGIHTRERYPLRRRVLGAVGTWRGVAAGAGDAALRALAEDEEVALVCLTAWAATGRARARDALDRARFLGVDHQPLPVLVRGRDLQRLGLSPGPAMGRVLAEVRRAQIAGRVEDRDAALALARACIDKDSGGPP